MENREIRKLSTLRLWDKNPRSIGKKEYEALKNKIKRWGQFKPVIITKDGEVIGGNMRLRAYQDLGIEDVWVSVVDPKTEAEKLEISIADNESSGRWDEQALAELLEPYKTEIKLDDYELDLGKPTNLNDLLDQFGPEPEEDEFDGELPEEPISKLGEIYQLGRHRLMCGDSTKIEDVERLMDGKKADMVFTDPPYGVDYEGGSSNKTKRSDSFSDDEPIYTKWLSLRSVFAKDTCAFYIWYAEGFDGTKLVYEAVENAGLKIRSQIIWNKLKAHYGALGAQYKQKHEPMLYCVDKPPKWFGESNECSVWDVEQSHLNEFHPTQKPIELSARAIRNSSEDNDIVTDLFLGSGSTLIACEQTNRICYGMEIDPRYIDVIRKRYAKFIGKEEEWEAVTPKITMK
jgi:DNA modification methylase